jgi:hypothetical protein
MNYILKYFRWLGLPGGILLIGLGLRVKKPLIKFPALLLGSLVSLLSGMVDYWTLRPNRAWLNPLIRQESWVVVDDGQHNSNTDLIYWRGAFYLVYAASPYHLASAQCRLVLLRSPDGRSWDCIARLDAAQQDIRDPKLAVIGDRLFLYALKNVALNPEPYTTVYTSSADGVVWEPLREIEPQGWLFWRPKSRDGRIWYVPAYWWEHGRSALFASQDGVSWRFVSQIYEGGRNDETDIEFLPDGRMLATARLEYSESPFGHPNGATLIAVSDAAYQKWEKQLESAVTRLDGPNLFAWRGNVYAVGRYQPEVRGPHAWQGSAFTRKRTALFAVGKNGLAYLTDLPSSGDTSYAGVVVKDDALYTCYYTSDIRRDPVWIVGMLDPSSIRMARLPLADLEAAIN